MNELADVIRLVKRVGMRIDAMSEDLARDAGTVARNAQAIADQATLYARATPRVTKIATAAAGVLARWRWLRLAQAARTGDTALRAEDHRDLAHRVAIHAAELRGGIAKIGQLASCRPDLIGAVWASELAALQDEVPPVDGIKAVVDAELGDVLATFEDAP